MRGKKNSKVLILPVVLAFGLITLMTSQLFAPYWTCGCTPGYWKNHLSEWDQTIFPGNDIIPRGPLMPEQPLATVFTIPSYLSDLADDSLLDALKYPGGSGFYGGARILLRAAVAGLLNSTHVGLNNINSPCSGYYGFYYFYCEPNGTDRYPTNGGPDWDLPCMIDRLVSEVNGALISHNRSAMIQLANSIDIYNNMTCPLGK